MSMEMHSVWARIDQLEQLILTQAKEIDSLRRLVVSTNAHMRANGITYTRADQKSLPSSRRNISSHSDNQLVPVQPSTIAQIHRLGSTLANCQANAPNRQPNSRTLCRTNYAMNPYVHPASAIPPVSNRVLTRGDTIYEPSRASVSPVAIYNNPDSQCNSYHSSEFYTNRPAANKSKTLPANNRWSTGPSLLGVLSDLEPGAVVVPSDQFDGPPRRRDRMSLIELITCFCPCFGMC